MVGTAEENNHLKPTGSSWRPWLNLAHGRAVVIAKRGELEPKPFCRTAHDVNVSRRKAKVGVLQSFQLRCTCVMRCHVWCGVVWRGLVWCDVM